MKEVGWFVYLLFSSLFLIIVALFPVDSDESKPGCGDRDISANIFLMYTKSYAQVYTK